MSTNGDVKPNGAVEAPGLFTAIDSAKPWDVKDEVAKIPGGAPTTGSISPIPFFHMLERLKTTKREGWRRKGIEHGESISDHMYRMSLITMFAPPSLSKKLDISRCMKMALIHDMAEAIVGDITPVDGVAKPEKSRRESTTMDYFVEDLLGKVNGGATGKEMKAIWQEYEDGVTEESKFVHDVDKIELILQMVEYEKEHKYKMDLGEFSWVATRIESDEVKEWATTVLQEREDFWGGRDHSVYSETSPPDPADLALKKEYYDNRTPAPIADKAT